MAGLLARIFNSFSKAEGEPRGGPFNLPFTGGWLPPDTAWNFWQLGQDPFIHSPSAIVERCVSLYSKTIASLPGYHFRLSGNGGKIRVKNSALSRILRKPNDYQSPSDFLLNMVRSLYTEGNAYALAIRNNRFEVEQLHWMDPLRCVPRVAYTGDIFYQLGGNEVIDRMLGGEPIIVPQRDVLHIRLHSDRRWPSPLVGVSPMTAAVAELSISNAFTQAQLQFLRNQARPSAVLSTDLVLDADQTQALRDRWNEQSKGLYAGGVPILTAGLKVQPWIQSTPAKDAQLAELWKFSAERICHAFDVPLQLLGLGGSPLGTTEALIDLWMKTGLGFALNHIEQSFDRLFDLRGEPDEYTEFDTEALLRSNAKDRIEMLVRGVQGGIYSPNEARNQEGLDSVPYGSEPRVQQQVVPLSAAAAIPASPAPPPAPPAAAIALPKMRWMNGG